MMLLCEVVTMLCFRVRLDPIHSHTPLYFHAFRLLVAC